MVATGFTYVSSLEAPILSRLSPKGRLHPGGRAWSLDWWIGTGQRWYKPGSEATVRQSRQGSGPVIDTRMRVGVADVKCRVYGVASSEGSDLVMEITNETKEPLALAIVIESEPIIGSMQGSAFVVDTQPVVVFDRQPTSVSEVEGLDDLPSDQAGQVAIFALLHGSTVRLMVPANPAKPPGTLPESDAVIRGWDAVAQRCGQFSFGDEGVTALARSSRARLLFEVPGLADRIVAFEPGAGRVLEALATSATMADLIRPLQAFAAAFPVELGQDPREAAAVLAGIGRAAGRLNDPQACAELLESSAQLAHLVEKSQDPEAAVDALSGLARVLRSAAQPEAAAHIERRINGWDGARSDIPEGLDAIVAFGQRASESGAFGPDDAVAAARYWLGARRLVLREKPGELELFANFPSAWRGGGIEVHDAVLEGDGRASLALRWHGYRPALLWDVAADGPMKLRCSSLDPSWSSTEPKGETLLAGSSEGLASVPSPGESFS